MTITIQSTQDNETICLENITKITQAIKSDTIKMTDMDGSSVVHKMQDNDIIIIAKED
jgi:hypothetical protein